MTSSRRDLTLLAGASRALVCRTLLQGAPLSRAELAERTGLSRPAITEICQELAELGVVHETGVRTPGRSAVGRPRAQMDISAEAGYAVGVLVAAENSAVTIVDLKGRVLDSVRLRPRSNTPHRVLAFLAVRAEERLERLAIDRSRIVGIGVSVPGVVDSREGQLRLSPFFGWANVPVRAAFQPRFGERVAVANPLQAIAVAELLFGSAARLPRPDLLLVNVSTAIAAAFVLGGRLQHGAEDASGQLGHVLVSPAGRRCRCGRRGCLDAVASGEALVAIAEEEGRSYASFAALLDDAAEGDAYAEGLLDASARHVGEVVGDAITLLNPSVVAVSGMVLQSGTRYVDRLREAALARAWLMGEKGPLIIPSAFGVLAGALGSAALALDAFVYAAAQG